MIVGMFFTGVRSNAPPNRRPGWLLGTQLGTCLVLPLGAIHGVTLLLSQPQPGPGRTPLALTGLSPRKLSVDAATMAMWPPQDGLSAREKVWSLMAKCCARSVMLGICLGWYPLTHL